MRQGLPKPLLPVGKKPLIDYWVDDFKECARVKEIYVVTNAFFHKEFEKWAHDAGFPPENIVNDGTLDNDTRLGAIVDINLVLETKGIVSRELDVLIVAGDTLFYRDFSVSSFVAAIPNTSATVYYELADQSEASKRGIIETDSQGYVTAFKEKPHPSQTTSRKACPALYFLTNEAAGLVQRFLDEKKDAPLAEKDAPGQLLAYLYMHTPVWAMQVSGRYDIGSIDDYRTTLAHFA
eukprot:comp22773_c0_seq2/m.35619 comp22773_c0_seq2/g.35619  ORF comp22773_c0_seq2/g.35619 comp22773_c0_seq2/m.35619 type:complete len:236 (-) comp22773_c0_seq2:132-839(-)